MKELLERLRGAKIFGSTLYAEAADAIESLQARVADLERDLDAVAAAGAWQNAAAGEVWKERDALRVKVAELEKDKQRLKNLLSECAYPIQVTEGGKYWEGLSEKVRKAATL